MLQVVSVEFTLQRGNSDGQHIFVFGRQEFGECGVIFSLLGRTILFQGNNKDEVTENKQQ